MKQQSGTARKKPRSVGQKRRRRRRRRLRRKDDDTHAIHRVKRQKRQKQRAQKREDKQKFYSWRDSIIAAWTKIFGTKDQAHHLEEMEKEITDYQAKEE